MTGVESANPFDLLGDESAPAPVAPVAAAKTSKAPASKAPASAPKQQQQQRSGMCFIVHSALAQLIQSKAPRNNVVSNAPPLSTAPKEAHSFEKKHAPKKPAHGRAFDRKSGTGRRDDGVKKNAVGKGNWGETVDGQLGADEVAAAEVAAVELDPEAEAAAAAAAAQAAEEAKYQTLDAFLANKTSAKWTEVQPRKANEGVDEKKWKDAKQLVKEEDEVIIVGKV